MRTALMLLMLAGACRADGFNLLGVISNVENGAKEAFQLGKSVLPIHYGSFPGLHPGPDMKGCPFAGHNTYGDGSNGHSRLWQALNAGLRAIEVDESWGILD